MAWQPGRRRGEGALPWAGAAKKSADHGDSTQACRAGKEEEKRIRPGEERSKPGQQVTRGGAAGLGRGATREKKTNAR